MSHFEESNPQSRNELVASQHLIGDEGEDQKTICNWFATSYGEVNKDYHEAYSREILRQIRDQTVDIGEDGSKIKKASWFC